MASPFSIFRKNQKVMIAVLTILAMFGFVFLPTVIMERTGGDEHQPGRREDLEVRQSDGEGLAICSRTGQWVLRVLSELVARETSRRRWRRASSRPRTPRGLIDSIMPCQVPTIL